MKRKIAILCSDDAHHRYLICLLRSRFNIVAVAIEPAANQRRRLLHSKRYRDYVYSVYHSIRRKVTGLDAYRAAYFARSEEEPPPAKYKQLVVGWINDPSVVDLIRQAAPDLTVVMGTGILRKELLEATGPMTVNVHGGYLPDYRGNHCFFFAIYDRAFDKIGSTIHFINSGIDTGDIVEVVVPLIYSTDTAETLYCRAEKLAIDRLVNWIDHFEKGGTLPRSPQLKKGRLCRTRDRKPRHDILMFIRRKLRLLVIPETLRVDTPMLPGQ